MVISTVCKNTFGVSPPKSLLDKQETNSPQFGMTYYFNDWAAASGFTQPLMLLMAMTVGFSLMGTLIFPYFGKAARRWTRDSKVHSF